MIARIEMILAHVILVLIDYHRWNTVGLSPQRNGCSMQHSCDNTGQASSTIFLE